MKSSSVRPLSCHLTWCWIWVHLTQLWQLFQGRHPMGDMWPTWTRCVTWSGPLPPALSALPLSVGWFKSVCFRFPRMQPPRRHFSSRTFGWMLFFFPQESGQMEQTVQTSMPCAGHMTGPCWPPLMTLAKCTCSPSPAVSQGSVMFAHTQTQKIGVRVFWVFHSRCRHVDRFHTQSWAALTKAGNTTSTCIKWIISVRCLFCTARLLFNKEKCWVQTANWSLTQLAAQTGWISSSQMFGWELQGILLWNPAHLRTFCG